LQATARTATGEERTKLWRQMTTLFAPYADYQKKAAGREIPVVVLDPLPAR
jgi:F420H(2)-dependent quinone reductase